MKGSNGFDIRRRRRREIETIACHVGAAETEDFDRYLVAWLQALPLPEKHRKFGVENAARRMRGKVTDAQIDDLIEQARSTPRPRSPDGWAKALGVTNAVRGLLGITTIGAIDVNRRQRAKLRKINARKRDERRRRARGIKPRSQSLSRTKPWQAEGRSRANWYRKRKADAMREFLLQLCYAYGVSMGILTLFPTRPPYRSGQRPEQDQWQSRTDTAVNAGTDT
jgi:hypothetical protein